MGQERSGDRFDPGVETAGQPLGQADDSTIVRRAAIGGEAPTAELHGMRKRWGAD
jgi:hypothetical protein